MPNSIKGWEYRAVDKGERDVQKLTLKTEGELFAHFMMVNFVWWTDVDDRGTRERKGEKGDKETNDLYSQDDNGIILTKI